MSDFIIVGFSTHRGPNLLAGLIRRGEGTPYSHVYIRFYSKSLDRWLVYQASGLAVNFEGFTRFLEKNVLVEEYRIDVTDEEKRKIVQWCVDEAGVPYGSKWFLGMAWVRLVKLWFDCKLRNPFPSGTSTFACSKLCGYVLKLLGKRYSDSELENADPKWINQQIRSWNRAVRLGNGIGQ
jgi:hypothetical protein